MEKVSQPANSRGWVFDALMECGQKLALVNHLEEKISALIRRAEEADDSDKAFEIMHKVDNMRILVESATTQRRKLMDYIMKECDASDEERCLLKHALLDYTIATELYEVDTNNNFFEQNMIETSELLAGAISLTLNMEFKTCLRCLTDKWTGKEETKTPIVKAVTPVKK